MEECIFCKITSKLAPAEIVYEDGNLMAFKDIYPKAPIHILIVPKKHIETVDHIESDDKGLIGEMFIAAKKIARDFGIAKEGYRLIFNVGRAAGQTVDHLHLHLLGGKKLPFA